MKDSDLESLFETHKEWHIAFDWETRNTFIGKRYILALKETGTVGFLFWKHRSIKKVRKNLLKFASNYKKILEAREATLVLERQEAFAAAALLDTFPEAMTKAFEKEILGVSDGASVDDGTGSGCLNGNSSKTKD